MNCFLVIVTNVLLVLVQSYETQAVAGSAVKGGIAVLRCAIPPAIKNDIKVTAWIQEFTGLTIFPSLQGGRFHAFITPSFICVCVMYRTSKMPRWAGK